MERPKKLLKLKISRTSSMSSNGPPSAATSAAQQNAPFFTQPVATPDAISPTSYFPASGAMSPSSRSGGGPSASYSTTMPPPAVPATPTDGRPKIKIRLPGKSQPSTPVTENAPGRTPLPQNRTPLPPRPLPAASPVIPTTTTKAGRTSRPTAKKRSLEGPESDDDEDLPMADLLPPPKKRSVVVKAKHAVSINGSGHADRRKSHQRIFVKDKLKSNSSSRLPGSGFDSEMEDAETGPITEEEIVFRMMEGPECDYINECLSNKKFPSGDSMTFKLKWLDDRRAAVTVNTQLFAAVLVDLPTVTEAMKTWDKKLVVKSADICQMLLAFAKITREDEAQTAPLPKVLFDGYRWPHGLTPPMHDAVHRRFRKRLHKSDILNKEQEVKRLLEEDQKAVTTRFEYFSERKDTQMETPGGEMLDGDGEEDAEGEDEEVELLEDGEQGPVDFDLEAEFFGSVETPGEAEATPVEPVETPAVAIEVPEGQGDDDLFGDEDESGEDYDEEDEESDEDVDQAERQRREEVRSVREEVREIDKRIKKSQEELSLQKNDLLRKRLVEKIKGAKDDKRLKLASIGEIPEDDED